MVELHGIKLVEGRRSRLQLRVNVCLTKREGDMAQAMLCVPRDTKQYDMIV